MAAGVFVSACSWGGAVVVVVWGAWAGPVGAVVGAWGAVVVVLGAMPVLMPVPDGGAEVGGTDILAFGTGEITEALLGRVSG